MLKYTLSSKQICELEKSIFSISNLDVSQKNILKAKKLVSDTLPDLSVMKEELDVGSGVVKFEGLPLGEDIPPHKWKEASI